MLDYLRDKLAALRLRARYQRLMQEHLLDLAEASPPQPVSQDPGRWMPLGSTGTSSLAEGDRADLRSQARQLVQTNPHARNLLRLLEIYVVGPGLKLNPVLIPTRDRADNPAPATVRFRRVATLLPPSASPAPITAADEDEELRARSEALWRRFLEANDRHYSFREHARRAWRDGEAFLRLYATTSWPPTLRFLDPECIAAVSEDPESQGIVTDPNDVEAPRQYLRVNPRDGQLAERIPADQILHTRIGVDSNQKRGLSLFTPIVDGLSAFDKWIDTELTARRLQASIVLWRKVQGSPAQAAAFADAAQTAGGTDASGPVRRERYRPGTILTTSHGTELQYLQPDTNFGDAVPLGRMLLLAIAAGGGVPEFMLTSDASNANFASTMVAEGPAVKLFQAEQQFFAAEFRRLWQWVMSEAIRSGYLPETFFDRVTTEFTFPQLVNRDRARERLADARLIEAGVLSRAEVARRDGVDPNTMRAERTSETP